MRSDQPVDMGEYDPFDDAADQTKKGWLTAILELGAWIGTLLSGFLAEALSRKYGVIVASSVFIFGVIIQTTAIKVGPDAILAGRFITYESIALFLFFFFFGSHNSPLTLQNTVVWVSDLSP
jgi:MFS family permease